jgi:hypothetical protein
MATPESNTKKLIRETLDGYGLRYSMNTTGGYGRSGDLDFTVNAWGYYLVIEAKSVLSAYGKRGPTALQWDTIDEVTKGGGLALVVDENTAEDLETVLDTLHAYRDSIRQEAHDWTKQRCERNHAKYERPNLIPATDTQPTIRKTRTK